LVLGGARSGKSAFAESLASAHSGEKIYIATAETIDDEMAERINNHKMRRGPLWQTLEAPIDLVSALRASDAPGHLILIDCISVWINNLMFHARAIESEVADLCQALATLRGQVVLVSNEVGSGIVPDNALSRVFRDEAGRANQALAAVADDVVLVVAGLPLFLKQSAPK
jgi:adenosylcobinamide kinase / adenosylcobinamide-phosphate guanylyltransferase